MRWAPAVAAGVALVAAGAALAQESYDFVPAWDVDFRHAGSRAADSTFSEIMGSGACVLDYDGDGWEDLLLVNGKYADPAAQAALDPRSALYRNDRGTGFVKVAGALELSAWGMGCAAGDYDGDGDPDVAISAWGGNVLYRNDGSGVFTNVTSAAGIHHPECHRALCFGASLAFLDYDKDADLDLYVTNYLAWDGVGIASPGLYPGQCSVMFRNRGDGTFVNASIDTGTMDCGRNHLALAIADVDGDGYQDIFVASDETMDTFLLNRGNGTFEDRSHVSNLNDPRGGMGAAWGDYDADGLLDLAITHFRHERFALYEQVDGLAFVDRGERDGFDATLPFVGWGVEFVDYDADADLDVLLANGNVNSTYGGGYGQRNLVLANEGGVFADRTDAAWHPRVVEKVSRGLAVADFDRDGYLDVVVTNNADEAPEIYRSVGGPGNYLAFRLEASAGMTPHALGARVEVTVGGSTQVREVVAAASYLSQSTRDVHVGIGDAASADRVRVTWPDGRVQEITNLRANRHYLLAPGGAPRVLAERPLATAPARVVANRVDALDLAATIVGGGAGVAREAWTVDGLTHGVNPVRLAFSTLGERTARFRVTDAAGAWDEVETVVSVENLAPVPVIDAPADVVLAQPARLSGARSADRDGTIVAWTWTIEGRTYHEEAPVHAFGVLGDVPVTLTVLDGEGAAATRTTLVRVAHALPVAVVDAPVAADRAHDAVFDAGASYDPDGAISSFSWDFGDGGKATGARAAHRYRTLGAFTATLVLVDDEGRATIWSRVVRVLNLPPRPEISAFAIANLNQDLPYAGGASADEDGRVVRWRWDFGGGAVADGPDARHAFAATGARTIALTVTDDDGASARTEQRVDVTDRLDVAVIPDKPAFGPIERPSGRVLVRFANGLPAADADVTLDVAYRLDPTFPRPDEPVDAWTARVTGRTDADGALAFEIDPPLAPWPRDAAVAVPSAARVEFLEYETGRYEAAATAAWRGNAGAGAATFHVRASPGAIGQ